LRLSVNGSLWISSEFGEMAQVKSGRTHKNRWGIQSFAQNPKIIFLSTSTH
jgi:hypothetical protein